MRTSKCRVIIGEMAWEVRLELKLAVRCCYRRRSKGEMAWEVRLELKLLYLSSGTQTCLGEMAWEVRLELKRLKPHLLPLPVAR